MEGALFGSAFLKDFNWKKVPKIIVLQCTPPLQTCEKGRGTAAKWNPMLSHLAVNDEDLAEEPAFVRLALQKPPE